jgi:hypothetical protein
MNRQAAQPLDQGERFNLSGRKQPQVWEAVKSAHFHLFCDAALLARRCLIFLKDNLFRVPPQRFRVLKALFPCTTGALQANDKRPLRPSAAMPLTVFHQVKRGATALQNTVAGAL